MQLLIYSVHQESLSSCDQVLKVITKSWNPPFQNPCSNHKITNHNQFSQPQTYIRFFFEKHLSNKNTYFCRIQTEKKITFKHKEKEQKWGSTQVSAMLKLNSKNPASAISKSSSNTNSLVTVTFTTNHEPVQPHPQWKLLQDILAVLSQINQFRYYVSELSLPIHI